MSDETAPPPAPTDAAPVAVEAPEPEVDAPVAPIPVVEQSTASRNFGPNWPGQQPVDVGVHTVESGKAAILAGVYAGSVVGVVTVGYDGTETPVDSFSAKEIAVGASEIAVGAKDGEYEFRVYVDS